MAVIKAITISRKVYDMMVANERKYKLILQVIINDYMENKDKIDRIDEITEDSYVFKKGE